jgi:hypothetical protein
VVEEEEEEEEEEEPPEEGSLCTVRKCFLRLPASKNSLSHCWHL